MKDLLLTRKRYNQLNGIHGGLIIIAIRILIGIIISFLDAFLVHSYISWGFDYSGFYPVAYIALGLVYFADAVLLFKKKQAFILMYLLTAVIFILITATFSGYGFLIYAGVETILTVYLFKSRRVAVTFQTRKIQIIDSEFDKLPH